MSIFLPSTLLKKNSSVATKKFIKKKLLEKCNNYFTSLSLKELSLNFYFLIALIPCKTYKYLSTFTAIDFYIYPPMFPLSFFLPDSPFFHFLPTRGPPSPWNGRNHSLLCCIAFARGYRKNAENLCWYSRPFNRFRPQRKNDLPLSVSIRGPAVTHPSTDPASCLTWVITWCRTPITHRTLSVRTTYIFLIKIGLASFENIEFLNF